MTRAWRIELVEAIRLECYDAGRLGGWKDRRR